MTTPDPDWDCHCSPSEWIGRIASHADLMAADGPMHSSWVCDRRQHREWAEAMVRSVGFDPIFTPDDLLAARAKQPGLPFEAVS